MTQPTGIQMVAEEIPGLLASRYAPRSRKLITIRNPFLLFLFGWGKFPGEVTGAPGLWWGWFTTKADRHV